MSEGQREIIKKTDPKGNTMDLIQICHKGELITHSPAFPDIGYALRYLESGFKPRKDDVLIHSYPKAGCHWTYEIVGILLSNKLEPLQAFKEAGFFEFLTCDKDFDDMSSPRLLNTHMRLKHLPKSLFTENKTICVLRNPKSVAVSNFHHAFRVLGDQYKYNGNLGDYLPLYMYSDKGKDFYGTWFHHTIEAWTELKANPNVLFVFYEQLKKDPFEIISRISSFLNLERSPEFIQGVVELTSFGKMAKFEGKVQDEEAEEIKKLYRKGSVADWKNHLTVAENEEFDRVYAEKMRPYPDLRDNILFG